MIDRNNNLTITLPNKKLEIKSNRIYRNLHSCQLLDKRLETIREFMKKKYDCDYCGIHGFNKETDMFFSNLDHEEWHGLYWKKYINNCPTLKISSQLKKGENGFLFFFDYDNWASEVRASIIGEMKEGFTVIFNNDNNDNRVQFSLTFRDGKSIGTFSAQIFNNLLQDLKKMQNIIDDFLEYFSKNEEIKDGKNLENFINSKNYKFPFAA